MADALLVQPVGGRVGRLRGVRVEPARSAPGIAPQETVPAEAGRKTLITRPCQCRGMTGNDHRVGQSGRGREWLTAPADA